MEQIGNEKGGKYKLRQRSLGANKRSNSVKQQLSGEKEGEKVGKRSEWGRGGE